MTEKTEQKKTAHPMAAREQCQGEKAREERIRDKIQLCRAHPSDLRPPTMLQLLNTSFSYELISDEFIVNTLTIYSSLQASLVC